MVAFSIPFFFCLFHAFLKFVFLSLLYCFLISAVPFVLLFSYVLTYFIYYYKYHRSINTAAVQLLSHVQLFVTPWTAACQASLSITSSRSWLKLMSIESVMPSNYLILCRPLLLLPSIFSTIRVCSNESALRIRWPKYWEFQLQHQSFQWIFRTDFF